MFTLDDVKLRPLTVADLEAVYEWESDVTMNILSGWSTPQSLESFVASRQERWCNPSDALQVYAVSVDGQMIGYAQLAAIDHLHGRGALGLLIGKAEARGRGYGKTALRILMDYAFHKENLEKVYAEVYAFNEPSRGLMASMGFVEEGVLRSHEVHNGQRQDMVLFGMLKAEFLHRYGTMFDVTDSL